MDDKVAVMECKYVLMDFAYDYEQAKEYFTSGEWLRNKKKFNPFIH